MSRRSLTVALSVAFVLSTCSFLQGQSTYGSITGAVTDPSGAAITDAQVTLTNLGTAEKRTQATGPDGLYTFVNLIPGDYKVEVEKSGFKHITRTPVVVEVQQSAKIDVTLPVGQANETVEVTAETPLLQSETSSLGQVVEQRKAKELPLNGRNIYSLAAIAPSVIPQGNTTGTPVGKNPFDFANYQIGGSFAHQSAERSGERRGGEEGRTRWAPDHLKKKKITAKTARYHKHHLRFTVSDYKNTNCIPHYRSGDRRPVRSATRTHIPHDRPEVRPHAALQV